MELAIAAIAFAITSTGAVIMLSFRNADLSRRNDFLNSEIAAWRETAAGWEQVAKKNAQAYEMARSRY